MSDLTPEGRRLVEDVAQRHGFGTEAVLTLLRERGWEEVPVAEIGLGDGDAYAM